MRSFNFRLPRFRSKKVLDIHGNPLGEAPQTEDKPSKYRKEVVIVNKRRVKVSHHRSRSSRGKADKEALSKAHFGNFTPLRKIG